LPLIDLRPISVQDAKPLIARWHRHNLAPKSGMFAAAVAAGDRVCGVAVIGRPVARELQDGFTAEIVRVATDGTRNACSKLYAAGRRAAVALGYRRVYTYTLASESGASLRAAGFVLDEVCRQRSDTWDTPSRRREQKDLFGQDRRPTERKVRWVWPATARRAA
jgi:hypothetical protein